MTPAQAANYLQVNIVKLGEWEKRYRLPTHRLGTGPKAHRRYFRDELDSWLKSRCTDTTPDQAVS